MELVGLLRFHPRFHLRFHPRFHPRLLLLITVLSYLFSINLSIKGGTVELETISGENKQKYFSKLF